METQFTFDKVIKINNIRTSIGNSILDMIKLNKYKCYIFGDYVHDYLSIEYAKKLVHTDRLKNILCYRFANYSKFEIDIINYELTFEKINEIRNNIIKIIREYQLLHKTKLTETKIRILKKYATYNTTILLSLLEFKCGNLKMGINITHSMYSNGINDFWINNLALNDKRQLTFKDDHFFKDDYYTKTDILCKLSILSKILLSLINGIAEPHDDLIKILTSNQYIKSKENVIYPNYSNQNKFALAYKSIEKILLYGYQIPFQIPKIVCVGATCCKTPITISDPKFSSGDIIYATCYSCFKMYTKNKALNIYPYLKTNILTDCQFIFN